MASMERACVMLDRIEVGRVRRQEPELGALGSDCGAHRLGAVAAQIVEDDDVALAQRGREELFDIGPEERAVDGAVDDARFGQRLEPQRRKERQRAPAAVGGESEQSLALGAPAPDRGHVGLDPGLVDENQAAGIETLRQPPPALPSPRDVRPMLLARVSGFF